MARGKKVGNGMFLKQSPTKFIGAAIGAVTGVVGGISVSYTHLTLPTNREV